MPTEITRGSTRSFSVSNNHDLDALFREGLDYLIEILQGDFSYVRHGTVSFYLKQVKPAPGYCREYSSSVLDWQEKSLQLQFCTQGGCYMSI